MSNYIPDITYQEEFEGDQLTITFETMNRGDVMKLQPVLSKIKKEMSDEEAAAVSNAMVEAIPSYIKKFDGLKDQYGNAISIDTVFLKQYFFPLASKIALKVMEASNPKSEDMGKKGKSKGK